MVEDRLSHGTFLCAIEIPKKYLRRFPVTINTWPVFEFSISIVLWGYIVFTMNGPIYLECNFSENKWSRDSYKTTLSDGLNVWREMCWLCNVFILSLKMHTFSYVSHLNSSNSLSWNSTRGSAEFKCNLIILSIQYAFHSILIGRLQALP